MREAEKSIEMVRWFLSCELKISQLSGYDGMKMTAFMF